ncbi:unnamed protein product [Brachionus calyciflorus]|uniref:Uncharacterized protein n=1 Tax=Brachionus calyciflorus TaxID=104777 RepID=A0A814CTZ7_9BILA|nr:unnamed protein product [Brachionus calyciflorus]
MKTKTTIEIRVQPFGLISSTHNYNRTKDESRRCQDLGLNRCKIEKVCMHFGVVYDHNPLINLINEMLEPMLSSDIEHILFTKTDEYDPNMTN